MAEEMPIPGHQIVVTELRHQIEGGDLFLRGIGSGDDIIALAPSTGRAQVHPDGDTLGQSIAIVQGKNRQETNIRLPGAVHVIQVAHAADILVVQQREFAEGGNERQGSDAEGNLLAEGKLSAESRLSGKKAGSGQQYAQRQYKADPETRKCERIHKHKKAETANMIAAVSAWITLNCIVIEKALHPTKYRKRKTLHDEKIIYTRTA